MKTKLFLAFVFFSFSLRAQNYTVTQIPYNPYPFDSGTYTFTPGDDAWSNTIGLGFDFYFFGHVYNQFIIGSNGLVGFNINNAGGYCQWPIGYAIPSPNLPTPSIMISYQDLIASMGGTIKHQVYGQSPHRRFVVSFDSVAYFSCTSQFFTGQMILYEENSNIEIHIHNKSICSAWNGGAAILGIQDSSGTNAYWAPNHNYPTLWSDTDVAYLFHPDSVYAPNQTNMNRISGKIFIDANHDCIMNNGEQGLMNNAIIFSDTAANYLSYMYADMNGDYAKMVDTGTYTVTTFNFMNNVYVPTCPPSGYYSIHFPTLNDSSDNNNFADTITLCSDLSIDMATLDTNNLIWLTQRTMNPCDTNYIFAVCRNNGTHADSATVILTLNDSTTILNSNYAYTSLGNNQYSFHLSNMQPGAIATIDLQVWIGCDTVGTWYCYSGHIAGTFPLDCGYYSDSVFCCDELGVPYDPNEMYVSANNSTNAMMRTNISASSNDALNYLITFQNTGTGVAHNVKVKTVLDSHLDFSSVHPTLASANYNWLILGDTLIFDFVNINLPDSGSNMAGSNGFIMFSANQAAGNTVGTSIIHHAGIYFDYMPAVITNNAVVLIETQQGGGVNEVKNGNLTFNIFPNPAKEKLLVNGYSLLGEPEIFIYDILGKEKFHSALTTINYQLSTINFDRGIYFIEVKSKNGIAVKKLIIE